MRVQEEPFPTVDADSIGLTRAAPTVGQTGQTDSLTIGSIARNAYRAAFATFTGETVIRASLGASLVSIEVEAIRTGCTDC